MTEWNEIRRPFREALISGFNWNSLSLVLRYHCDRRLDRITAQSAGFDSNVDEVIEDAVRNGWLEKLAQGALDENERHSGLNATVPLILAGVEAEGKTFYQDEKQKGEASGGSAEPDVQVMHQRLVDEFNIEELQDLCFAMGIDYEELSGAGKSAKARELVLYMQRRGRLGELNEAIRAKRG
jgi:hypothetical protein